MVGTQSADFRCELDSSRVELVGMYHEVKAHRLCFFQVAFCLLGREGLFFDKDIDSRAQTLAFDLGQDLMKHIGEVGVLIAKFGHKCEQPDRWG